MTYETLKDSDNFKVNKDLSNFFDNHNFEIQLDSEHLSRMRKKNKNKDFIEIEISSDSDNSIFEERRSPRKRVKPN
jgi:hypothetical protein